MMHVAILGAGGIANAMAKTVKGMEAGGEPVKLYAVAARSEERAQAFADKWGIERAYGSYEEMLCDERVDLVYIATPHSHHAEHATLCIEHGKAVLCEKAFAGNARQAQAVLDLAKEKGVFITEAIWPRYMPSRRIMNDLIAEGAIGEPVLLTAQFGGAIHHIDRIRLPELAGGALLDLGVYTISFATLLFGTDVIGMESTASLMDTGVDQTENITLYYPGGKTAHLMNTVMAETENKCIVYGTKGWMAVEGVTNPQRIEIYDRSHSGVPLRVAEIPEQITGYEYEVRACMRALENGELECPEMPHEETMRVMRMMDALREQWGVRYPFD